jgi:cysteine desulfurase
MQFGSSIYLDYQATTPLDPRVIDKMSASYELSFANPHSTQHLLGQEAAREMDQARAEIENFIGAETEEVIFTSGATEANNQAIASVLMASKGQRKTVLISAIEHKCIKNAAYFYADKFGAVVQEIPVLPTGLIDLDAYQAMLSDKVCLVCVMAVNNEIGTIQDIPLLAEMAHQQGALFHCDAAQAPEAVDIDVRQWQVDMLSLSAHKVYGPKGMGVLYMKNLLQASLPPLIQGGGQQAGMRSGTVPTALCVGFAEALRLSREQAIASRARLAMLRQRLIDGLEQAGIAFSRNGSAEFCHPGNLNIQFEGIDASRLIEVMQPTLSASTGSACNSEMVLPSHVLKALGLSDEAVTASMRLSLGRFSDESQIDRAVEVIAKGISQLQAA